MIVSLTDANLTGAIAGWFRRPVTIRLPCPTLQRCQPDSAMSDESALPELPVPIRPLDEVTVPAAAVPEGFSDTDLAELFITATVRRGDGDGVTVTRTSDHKCGRCWRLLPEVVEDGSLCARCDDVVGEEVAS